MTLNRNVALIDQLFPDREHRVLREAQSQLLDQLQPYVEDYYANVRPGLTDIHIKLGLDALIDLEGIWHWEGTAEQMVKRVHDLGKGAYLYQKNVNAAEVAHSPKHVVLRLERLCRQHNLRAFRSPAGDGMDIMFSLDPLDAYPKFDNEKYIPSDIGYYGIIGTGAARD